MKRRLFQISVTVFAMLMVFTACGGGGTSGRQAAPAASTPASPSGSAAAATPAAPKKDTLMFRLNSEPVTLDPQNCNDTGVSQNPHYQLFDSLTRIEQDGTLNMALAESITASADGKTLAIKIRPNVKFHNGDIMTAEDVAYSLNRSIESKFNSIMTSSFDRAEKVDDTTVNLYLKYAYSPAISCLATIQTCIVPKKVVEADPDGFARNPVGTGCFKLVSWASGDRIEMEAYSDYYRGEPAIKKLTYAIIPDHSTALIALEKGEIDVMINPNLSDRQRVIDNPELTYHESPAAAYMLFTFNNEKGRFADKRMRQAVSMVTDREALIIGSKEGLAEPVEAAMLPILPEYPQGFKSDPYDPERAKALVKEAGCEGITVKVPTIDAATYVMPTTMLQEMLRPIGINVEIEIMERGAWNEKVLVNTNYELCVWACPITVLDADFAAYGPFYSGNRGGSGNFSNCNIPRIDELVQLGRVTPPGPERNAYYKEFCEIMQKECVIVPYLIARRELPARADLKGLVANPTLRYYVFDAYWE